MEHSLGSAVVSGEYSKKSIDAASRSRADEIVVNTFMTFFAYLYGKWYMNDYLVLLFYRSLVPRLPDLFQRTQEKEREPGIQRHVTNVGMTS